MTKEANPLVTPENISKLKSVLEKHEGQEVAILVAQNDPDAISCSMGFSPVLRQFDIVPKIYHAGGFGHPQNKVLYDEFELMKSFTPISELPDSIPCILVDSSRLQDNRFGVGIKKDRFIGIIDHHLEKVEENENMFVVLQSCGAAATLVKLIADACGVDLDERIRTLLAIGIMADTDKLTHPIVTQTDREVFIDLMRNGDQELLGACFNYTLPEHYKDLLAEVLSTEETVQSVRIAHPQHLLNEDDGDLLSIIADDLLKLEGAPTVVVWGIPGGGVRSSVRSRKRGSGLSKFIESVFGRGSGGAKHGSGGARVSLAPFEPTSKTAEALINYLDAHYKDRIQHTLGRPEKEPAGN